LAVSARLRALLDRSKARYEFISHAPADMARETAAAMRLPDHGLAKVVVVRQGEDLSLAVLTSPSRVDLDRLGAALRGPVELAPEPTIATAFPDCEIGAVPPFGVLYGLRTYMDESLTHERDIVFHAGSHAEVIRMPVGEYRRVAEPIVLWLAREPARPHS